MAERIKSLILIQTVVGLAVLAVAVLRAVDSRLWGSAAIVAVALLGGLPAWLLAGERHGRWAVTLDLGVWVVAVVLVLVGNSDWSLVLGPGVLLALSIVGLAFVLREEKAAWWMAALCTVVYLAAVALVVGSLRDFVTLSESEFGNALLTVAGIWGAATVAWAMIRTWRLEVAVARQGRDDAQAAAAEQSRLASELEQRAAEQAARLERVGEWSLPALALHDHVVVLPLGGYLDEARAAQARQALLQAIASRRATVALIDVTNLPAVDASGAQHLKLMVEAGRLLGADVVLVGMRPPLANSLIASQVDVRMLAGHIDLPSGLEWALSQTGWRIVSNG